MNNSRAPGADQPTAGDRSAKRFRVLKTGMRDFSAAGARLILDPGMTPPDVFDLIIAVDGIEADCVVKWRRGREVGVAFAELGASLHLRKQSLLPTRPEQKPTLRRKQIVR